MKIFFYALRPFDELPIAQKLSEKLNIEFGYTSEYPNENNIILAKGYDAISTTPTDLSAKVLEAFYSVGVRNICCRSIGYDHVDLEYCKKMGIRVSYVTYPSNGVANFAIMLMLNCLRSIPTIMAKNALNDFSLKGKIGKDLSSCTVGIIGTGKIGTTVIEHLAGFGCKILAYDLYPNETVKKYGEYVSLETLLKNSDVISLHCNATNENYHLLDEEAFRVMKDGVIIINTSRGKLVDTFALIKYLENGKVASAGLDVLEKENGLYYYDLSNKEIDNEELKALQQFENVILTAHTAFYCVENVGDMVKNNFLAIKAWENDEKFNLEVQ